MRSLEKQVAPEAANRLRTVQEALNSFRMPGRASGYYIFEISRAIDAGMLLSTVVLASSLLEIWVRDLLVVRKATQRSHTTKRELRWHIANVDKEIEGQKRGLPFNDILSELVGLDVIDDEERKRLRRAFTTFRNPLMHGISGRFLGESPNLKDCDTPSPTHEEMFLMEVLSGVSRRSIKLEEKLDYSACEYLETIINFVADHPLPEEV